MKPAKEFIKSFGTCNVGRLEFVEVCEADILARDIEVLEEAARLTCPDCNDSPRTHPAELRGQYWVHRSRGNVGNIGCKANDINDRIAELKKERADGAN